MPELPEVEVVKRSLSPLLLHTVEGVYVREGKIVQEGTSLEYEGCLLEALQRRGRYLLFVFRAIDQVLVVHLGMTGNLRLSEEKEEATIQWDKHEFLRIYFSGGLRLSYEDYRRFGKIYSVNAEGQQRLFSSLGVEPLSDAFRADYLLECAKGKRRELKSFLMDNQVVTGIGNIYANEVLFATRQHPQRRVNTLSLREWQEIVRVTQTILDKAITLGGSSIKDYTDGLGQAGDYQNFLRVYGRRQQPCLNCGKLLTVIKQGGRSTFFCEFCQAL